MLRLTESSVHKISILVYLLFSLPLIFIATKDIRLISVFNIDAIGHLEAIHRMVNGPFWDPDLYYYGDAYFYLAAAFGLIYKIFHTVGDRELILILRSINLIFGVLSIDALWRLTRKYFSPFVTIWTVSFFAINYWVLHWSLRSHPDIMQVYFMIAGLYYACELVEDASKKNIILSSLFAGFAFGTKYGGMFLLPCILFGYLLFHLKRPDFKWLFLKGKEFWKSFFLSGTVFILSFLFTSPYRLVHPSKFLFYINYQRIHNKMGHWFLADKNKLLWIPHIYAEDFLGRMMFVLFFGYLVLITIRFMREPDRFRHNIQPAYVLLFWVLSFLGYTIWEINIRWGYYLLPILPFMIIFTGVCFEEVVHFIDNRPLFARYSKVLVAVMFLAVLAPKCILGYELFVKEYHRMDTPDVQAGLWLEKNFPESTRILYDKFSYVPSKFRQVQASWGIKQQLLDSFKPDLIVTNQKLTQRYDKESKADLSWDWGREHYLDCFYFYRDLGSRQVPSFKLIKDFNEVKIYANRLSLLQLNQ